MSAFRPLPPRPSLEFEHKEAKALLRRLRAGDPDALARAHARHPAIDASSPTRVRLADAQLVIAREYGFASWPRLVRYFGDIDRQRHGFRSGLGGSYDAKVRALLSGHRRRGVAAGRSLAAFVPRFYGLRVEDVFDATVTEDEVRLAVARSHGFPSWEVLLQTTAAEVRPPRSKWEVDPMRYASEAIEAADLDALKRVVAAHPELLRPSDSEASCGYGLMTRALHRERQQGVTAMQDIIAWLDEQGLDVQLELNCRLCGHIGMKTDDVGWLLDRGADPNWVAPNGIPVLEHALYRYWNGEAVDLVAARARPRSALWIAAGLGDVDGVRRFLDRRGRPTVAARQLRPDFVAIGPRAVPSLPDADDEEILMEAFSVAMLNGRSAVLEYMASRGFPVDSVVWAAPVIHVAIGNAMAPMVESLIRCGANLDLVAGESGESAREVARSWYLMMPKEAARRRTAELCGIDPDALLAERDAQPAKPPAIDSNLREALELAGDDAFRLGQSDILPENLLFGLLRSGGFPFWLITQLSRMDLDRFRADARDRVRPPDDRMDRPKLRLDAAAQSMIDRAIAIATERRRETVGGVHLLSALLQSERGATADLLVRYGASAAIVNEALESAL